MALKLQNLIDAKEKHKFSWYWIGPELPPKKNVGKSCHAYFELLCGRCHKKKWVEWSALSLGKNHSCKSCAKLPTLEYMKEIAAKYKMLWIPTLQFKSDTNTKRRVYKMRCSRCMHDFWVRWNHFQQGTTTGCKSCLSRKARGSFNDDLKYYKHPLRQEWKRLGFYARVDRRKDNFHWKTFEEFFTWAMENKYNQYELPKLKRKITKLGFIPSNCYWQPTVQPDTILPGGKMNYEQRFI